MRFCLFHLTNTIYMSFLFWLFWGADLLIGLATWLGKGFRESFTDSSINIWFFILMVGCILGGLVLRLAFKKALLSLLVVALPLLVLLVWYFLDTRPAA